MKRILLAASLLASLGAAQAASPLVVDGGFESVSQGFGSWNVYNAIDGWTTTSGTGIEVRNHVAGNAFEGQNYVELDSNSNSAMAQTITTTAGSFYTLSFEYSAREGVSVSSTPIEVLWNGSAVATVALDGIGQSGNVWHGYSYTVQGTGSDTLTFSAVGTNDSVGGSLDAVALTAAVPEPSTYALMVGGLALLGFSARRRSRR